MSKKFLAGISLGLALPLIAGGVVFGVPSIRNKILSGGNNSELNNKLEILEKENKDLKNENTSLKQNNVTYAGRIENLSAELATAKSSIEQKDVAILDKESQINTLTEDKEKLQSELDTYKELVGSDVNYIEIISSLQSQLDEKTSQLTVATAELEQLRVDKISLENRVAELETELEKTQQELANYKTLGNIDKLKTTAYDGTWYLNGTFEDYYTIENGVVTHNANEDKGLLNVIYNQMYLMLNTAGGTEVTLSDDGTYFTTEDGAVYSKFYINTEKTATPNYLYCGTYSNGSTQIKLNADNTTTMTDGENTYIGAYLVTTKEKNIGGNITRYNTITATYQTDNEPIVKVFENTSNNDLLDDGEVVYSLIEFFNGVVLSNTLSKPYEVPSTYYFKVIVKTNDYVTIEPGQSVKVIMSFSPYTKYGSGNFTMNGISFGSSTESLTYYNSSSDCVCSNLFEFYVTKAGGSSYYPETFYSIGGSSCKIVGFVNGDKECHSSFLYGDFYRFYFNAKDLNNKFTIPCQTISNYTNGTYTDDSHTITLTEESAIINDITATSYDVLATTDGTDIYQTVTLKYTTSEEEIDTNHTVILTFKNNQLQTTKLDDEDLTLSRN